MSVTNLYARWPQKPHVRLRRGLSENARVREPPFRPATGLLGEMPRQAEPAAEGRRAPRPGEGRPAGDRGARAAVGGFALKKTEALKLLLIAVLLAVVLALLVAILVPW